MKLLCECSSALPPFAVLNSIRVRITTGVSRSIYRAEISAHSSIVLEHWRKQRSFVTLDVLAGTKNVNGLKGAKPGKLRIAVSILLVQLYPLLSDLPQLQDCIREHMAMMEDTQKQVKKRKSDDSVTSTHKKPKHVP